MHFHHRRDRSRGQALVEFALVFPLFMFVMLGLVEFAFVFNAVLATNFSSRTAALLAAEAGNQAGADCVILQSVDDEITAPADDSRVVSVDIYWSDTHGVQKGSARTTYARGGSTTCTYAGGVTVTVPYTRTTNAYPEAERCNMLDGCTGTTAGFSHANGLDTVGVRVTYSHLWKTPLENFLRTGGSGFIIDRSNAMRMEPIL